MHSCLNKQAECLHKLSLLASERNVFQYHHLFYLHVRCVADRQLISYWVGQYGHVCCIQLWNNCHMNNFIDNCINIYSNTGITVYIYTVLNKIVHLVVLNTSHLHFAKNGYCLYITYEMVNYTQECQKLKKI